MGRDDAESDWESDDDLNDDEAFSMYDFEYEDIVRSMPVLNETNSQEVV